MIDALATTIIIGSLLVAGWAAVATAGNRPPDRGQLAGLVLVELALLVQEAIATQRLVDGDRLPEPIFTPASKAELGEHDENVDLAHVVADVGEQLATTLRDLTVAVYAACLCPAIDPDYIRPGEVAGKAWDYVEDRALNGPYATDAHYVKGMEPHAPYLSVIVYWTESSRHFLFPALRVLRDASRTWGDAHERYLAAAVRFADDFRGWVH